MSYQKRPEYVAYSDGSCDNLNPQRPGGAAFLIMDTEGKIIAKKSKGFMNTSNNRMELTAIIGVVHSVPNNSFVTINTDSEYCIKALLGRNPQANLDLIKQYYSIKNQKNVTVLLHWVKGHNGNQYNEECDKMAREEYAKMALNTTGRVTKPSKRKRGIIFEIGKASDIYGETLPIPVAKFGWQNGQYDRKHYTIEIKSLEELLSLKKSIKFPLIIDEIKDTKDKEFSRFSITIYDDYIE